MMSRPQFFAWARNSPNAPRTTEQLYFAYEVYLTCPLSREPEQALFHAECGRCGNCCRKPWRIEVSLNDVRRWINEKRTDILETLEHRPRHTATEAGWGISTDARHTAIKALECGEEYVATALTIASASASGGDSYVIPKARGCAYLIEGEAGDTRCAIYDTRPDVCRNFPSVEQA